MPITSSVLTQESAQADGRRWIEEVHTDHLGLRHVYRWLAAVGADANAVMAARVARILEQLEAAEIEANVSAVLARGSEAVTSLDYSTAAQNFAVLRVAYQTATRVQAVMIGDFLSSLTDAQLRTAFSMTQTQVNNLRANKLTPAANLATSIRATTGA